MNARLAALLTLAAAALTGAAACGDDGGSPAADATTVDFDRRGMLANLADNVILPTYRGFDASADALVVAVDAWCAALGDGDASTTRSTAQDAWKAAMLELQRALVMQIGPLRNEAVRDPLYSWPLVNTCAIDQEVKAYFDAPDSYSLAGKTPNRRGLDALEYALFSASLEHTCPVQSAPPGWEELADADRVAARCGYAAVAARDLAANAQALVDAWEPSGGNFAAELKNAGAGSSTYGSAQEGINAVSDALYYVDFAVKDDKLAEPAGLAPNQCGMLGEVCLLELESPHAGFGARHIAANLEGLQRLFLGDGPEESGGLGFDDYLRAAGAPELATTMESDIAAALAAAGALPASMRDALTGEYDQVVATHAAVKAFTDNLKSQFQTVLNLRPPGDLPTDND